MALCFHVIFKHLSWWNKTCHVISWLQQLVESSSSSMSWVSWFSQNGWRQQHLQIVFHMQVVPHLLKGSSHHWHLYMKRFGDERWSNPWFRLGMLNEATLNSVPSSIQHDPQEQKCRWQRTKTPPTEASTGGGGTGGEGPGEGGSTGELCTGFTLSFTLMPILATNATNTR